MNSYQKLKYKLLKHSQQIAELYVVIDTLQTNLASAASVVGEEKRKSIENHSYKWCINWKPGDEQR